MIDTIWYPDVFDKSEYKGSFLSLVTHVTNASGASDFMYNGNIAK